MCEHVFTPCGEIGDEGMILLNSCLSVKELAYVWKSEFCDNTTQFCRCLAPQALVKCLSKCWCLFGWKVPILLNWVIFKPGIWDGGATSSTDTGAWKKSLTSRCLGLAPMRGSKQCGIDILPIFLLGFGSNLQMCVASFASWVIWKGSVSTMLKLEMEGKGWWWSVQCFCMVELVNLECSLTLSSRTLYISLT